MSQDVLNLMREHISVRKYTDEQIPEDVLRDIIEAGRAASTWKNLHSYSIILVRDMANRQQIAEWMGMPWIAKCPVFMVFVGDMHRGALVAEHGGQQFAATGVESLLISSVDAALCAENVLLAAESLGYGGVFIGVVRNKSLEISEMLGLPEHTYPLFGLCLGRPVKKKAAKPRIPYESAVFDDKYGQVDVDDLLNYDQTQIDYLASIGAPAGDPWSTVSNTQWANPTQTNSTENLKAKKLL